MTTSTKINKVETYRTQGMSVATACKKVGISVPTYYARRTPATSTNTGDTADNTTATFEEIIKSNLSTATKIQLIRMMQ